jgi:Transposase and inactivated derivatives
MLSSSIGGLFYVRIGSMRKPRQLQDGARYHVTARINRKEMIFDSDVIKELFLSVVQRAKGKYGFRLETFCIMGNHFHFVIQPGRGQSLSKIMQWILSVFAMSYNRIKGFTGHVWGSRFFSRIIGNFMGLLETFRYIDNNPIKAGLVEDRRTWKWSGIWQHRMGYRELIETPAAWLLPYIIDHEQLLLQ